MNRTFRKVQILQLWLGLASVTGFVNTSSAAPFFVGDVLLNHAEPDGIEHYRSDGTLVDSYTGSGSFWEGATYTRDGRLATTYRGPSTGSEWRAGGVNLFNSAGQMTSFSTSQVNLAGDLSEFRDGSLALSSQWGSTLELYSPSGSHLRTISHSAFAGDRSPFGTAVGPDDTIWCALGRFPTIEHFAKDGTHLGSFEAAENVGELVVDHVDGSLWMPGQNSNMVYHYSPTGTLLGSFPTLISPQSQAFNGIAMSPQRTLYVVSERSSAILHYDRTGNYLGQIPISAPSYRIFMSVVLVPEPASAVLLLVVGIAASGVRLVRRLDA